MALKVLDGSYRPDKDGDLAEQVQASGVPVPPAHLNAEACAFWAEVVPGLIASGVAAACDATQLAAMCEWWCRYRRFSRDLDEGRVLPKDVYQTTVLAGIAWTNFDKIAARFGLTPSDRAKLRVQPTAAGPRRVASRKRG